MLETAQVLDPLEHLRGRLAGLAEAVVDLVRRLLGVRQPAVDLRVELGEPAVHRLDHASEALVDVGVPLGELGRRVVSQHAEPVSQDTREPREAGSDEERDGQEDEEHRRHTGRRTLEMGSDRGAGAGRTTGPRLG